MKRFCWGTLTIFVLLMQTTLAQTKKELATQIVKNSYTEESLGHLSNNLINFYKTNRQKYMAATMIKALDLGEFDKILINRISSNFSKDELLIINKTLENLFVQKYIRRQSDIVHLMRPVDYQKVNKTISQKEMKMASYGVEMIGLLETRLLLRKVVSRAVITDDIHQFQKRSLHVNEAQGKAHYLNSIQKIDKDLLSSLNYERFNFNVAMIGNMLPSELVNIIIMTDKPAVKKYFGLRRYMLENYISRDYKKKYIKELQNTIAVEEVIKNNQGQS